MILVVNELGKYTNSVLLTSVYLADLFTETPVS